MSLQSCIANATFWYNGLVEQYPPPQCVYPNNGIFLSDFDAQGGTITARYCDDFVFTCGFTWEDSVPPEYCEEMACNCASELNQIYLAVEQLSVSLGELLGTISEHTNDIRTEVMGLATPLNSIAVNTGNLSGINTGVGVTATGVTFIGTQLDLIEGYQAAQTVSQGAIAAGVGTLATEVPLLVAATEQNALNNGATASAVGNLGAVVPILSDVESDLFGILGQVEAIEGTLNAIEDCVCEGGTSSSNFYVKLDGPVPTTNSATSPGGGGESRFFPYAGIAFRPKPDVFPALENRIGEIHWVTFRKSLTPYPPGGPDKWDAIIVPSPAVDASELTLTTVEI